MEGKMMHIIKLPSGRHINLEGFADSGAGSNGDHWIEWPIFDEGGTYLITLKGDDAAVLSAELDALTRNDTSPAARIKAADVALRDALFASLRQQGCFWL
jgi:hypothetical protein